MRRQSGLLTRRGMLPASVAALLVPAWARSEPEADYIQPLAKVSGFPQMPTGAVGVTPCGSLAPPAAIPSVGRIAAAGEPGETLEISGRVLRPDRITPAAGVVIFAYHTDIHGHYNTPNSPFRPRIFGWIKSDDQGRYRFATIKPTAYPDHSSPAHIHVSLFAKDLPEYWVDDYWFAGDPLITPQQRQLLTGRGGGGETLTLQRDATGVLHGQRNFILQHVAVSGGCKLLHA